MKRGEVRGPLAAIRQLFASPLADWATGRSARHVIPRLESEVRALGRSFGAPGGVEDPGPAP